MYGNDLIKMAGLSPELVRRGNEYYISSLNVARLFDKPHGSILMDARRVRANYFSYPSSFYIVMEDDEYKDHNGNVIPYLWLSRDAVLCIAETYLNKRGLQAKMAVINAFDKVVVEEEDARVRSEVLEELDDKGIIQWNGGDDCLPVPVQPEEPEVEIVPTVEIQDGEVVTTSLNIAEVFGKPHKIVLRDIRDLLGKLVENKIVPYSEEGEPLLCPSSEEAESKFTPSSETVERLSSPYSEAPKYTESTYTGANGKKFPMYLLNRNATVLLIMGYTTERALQFKLAYIEAFDKMRYQLLHPAIPAVSFEEKMEVAEKLYQKYTENPAVATYLDALVRQEKGFSPLGVAGLL